ncbi:MAG: phosphotransferase [Proteobacteria bacterium]|nr:phosphotransferase [Pseudomonadota bacterium]
MPTSEMDLKQWLSQQIGTEDYQYLPLPGDASFRTYSRIINESQSYIVMHAPPGKERTDEFVKIATAWHEHGLLVPQVLAWERNKGFVLLTDFGDDLLLAKLNPNSVDAFYNTAMKSLIHLQGTCPKALDLPPYDAAFALLELSHFKEWFINRLLNCPFSPQEAAIWEKTCDNIVHHFCEQPQVTVHRDYHSRNLMVLPNTHLGIIDFQDAMHGPITYDIASLLKDCYIDWRSVDVQRWLAIFYEKLKAQGKLPEISLIQFNEWFDWVGLQRHLKVLGIFSRLNIRDNKPRYLQYLPRIMHYVLEVTGKYEAFAPFHQYLIETASPKMLMVLEQHNNLQGDTAKVA